MENVKLGSKGTRQQALRGKMNAYRVTVPMGLWVGGKRGQDFIALLFK